MEGSPNGLFSTRRIHHKGDIVLKGFMDLPVVYTQANDGFYFLLYEVTDQGIIISLVHAAEYQDRGLIHAFQRIPCAIDIGRFGIVDELHAPDRTDIFHAMLERFEAPDRFADLFLPDADGGGGDSCCHSIVLIVYTLQGKIVYAHLQPFRSCTDCHLTVSDKSSFVGFLLHGEWKWVRIEVRLAYICSDHGIILVVDEIIFSSLVHHDPELAANIVLELIVVTVEMIFRDIGEDR